MPGGRRNPLSVSRIVEAVKNAKSNVHDAAVAQVSQSLEKARLGEIPFVDIEIQFIGASGLPKMDVVGTADPYFVAHIDDKTSFVSTVKSQTLAPVWNEVWRVKNVPAVANLYVEVMDKDDDRPHDDYFGKFKVSVDAGTKEVDIDGPLFRKSRGSFWLKIDSHPSTDDDPSKFPYLFDGPIRYSRHFSPTVGRLTNLNDARLYSTWKMYLRSVPVVFGDSFQGWNRHYKAAQNIFQGPTSLAVRSGIQAGHRMLYARKVTNVFGVMDTPEDVKQLLRAGSVNPNTAPLATGAIGVPPPAHATRIKPAVYTYIISAEDSSFRFSETGAAFFVDFASKHALHSNCAEQVRYSGEFHPRPVGGWAAFDDSTPDDEVEWELVIDNNSGTYAPDKALLSKVEELFALNFPWFRVYAWDREDPRLEESVSACREYALKWRGVSSEELQPHTKAGEETLEHQVEAARAQEVSEAAGVERDDVN
ncbi:hypothetical protein DXG03_004193 [Asterophora parasitica]|uniref:C2 domain-containing protein n=1 Tax=Asterophora parasitica TaxID=117018 RepID=A0A9P7KA68_9AGAR|nr:hypothetical protein DXG03_004193 [Asterophora parasitica]